MGEKFAVETCLEDIAHLFQALENRFGVDEAAITGHYEIAGAVTEEERLHGVKTAIGDVGITNSGHTNATLQLADRFGIEDAVHQA